MVLGQLVGVLAVESDEPVAFGPDDEALLTVVATMVASAIEIDWAHERAASDAAVGRRRPRPRRRRRRAPATTRVRFFAVDGSTFLDGDYLIKGVAGRMLWVAARPPRTRGPHRVHQQGGAARPDARAARVPRQPREPPDPAEAPARRARRARSASRRPAAAASGWSSTATCTSKRSTPTAERRSATITEPASKRDRISRATATQECVRRGRRRRGSRCCRWSSTARSP